MNRYLPFPTLPYITYLQYTTNAPLYEYTYTYTQGEQIDLIDDQITTAADRTEKGVGELEKALGYPTYLPTYQPINLYFLTYQPYPTPPYPSYIGTRAQAGNG
jgi:hypothetical protein